MVDAGFCLSSLENVWNLPGLKVLSVNILESMLGGCP